MNTLFSFLYIILPYLILEEFFFSDHLSVFDLGSYFNYSVSRVNNTHPVFKPRFEKP